MLICPIKVTFFFTVNSFYKYVQSNQSNVRGRKILSHHKQMLFLQSLLIFSAICLQSTKQKVYDGTVYQAILRSWVAKTFLGGFL